MAKEGGTAVPEETRRSRERRDWAWLETAGGELGRDMGMGSEHDHDIVFPWI
jgi:hypothetical protein